jgi:membrane protein DedA with SNARE-associated domain
MSDVINSLVVYIESFADKVPLELFVMLGSMIEEIIAPIPSPILMTFAGSLAHTKDLPIQVIFWLAMCGAIGKTAGAYVLYVIADKTEDILVGKFGKWIGVSHKEVEGVGKWLNKGWKDNIIIFFARAVPIVPSAPVSLACGLIKLNMRTYLSATLAGTYVRDLLYLYLGYVGLSNYHNLLNGFESAESIVQLVIFGIIATLIGWAYVHRHHQTRKQKRQEKIEKESDSQITDLQ